MGSSRQMEHPEITDHSPKVFVVLGSKRGGTSFLAQVLGENGVHFDICGNGHNEDLDFVKFNNAVLETAGGDWNDLPPDEAVAEAVEEHGVWLNNLVHRKAQDRAMWGWKDPRQGATIKHILPYLEDDVYLVCVFRKPDKVAESMGRIWGRPHDVDRRIVMDYYRRIIDGVRAFIGLDEG